MSLEIGQPDFGSTYATVDDFVAGDYVHTSAASDASVELLHVVNPVAAKPGSDLVVAQPVTFASMHSARRFAAQEDPALSVRLAATVLAQDAAAVPEGMERLPDLTRTVLDVASFERPRALPLVFDILGRAQRSAPATDADLAAVVLTNVDIGLMPHFYLLAADLLRRGYDAVIVNRRSIARAFAAPQQLPLMYAQHGSSHPGLDCFIIERSLLDRFVTNRACVGGGFVMRGLLFNLVAHAERLRILLNAQATFHIGDDAAWATSPYADYEAHNKAEALSVFRTLSADPVKAERLRRFAMQTNENWLPPELLGLPAKQPSLLQPIKSRLRGVLEQVVKGRNAGQPG